MVFCTQCGVPGQGRFCSQCGTPLSGVNFGAPPQPSQPPPYTEQEESITALIGSQGQLMPAFHHIASELFIALDQSIEPKGTRGLEPSKMTAFRQMGGKSIPQYYGSHVLPVYYNTIGAECVPGMPKLNVLTWNGWHTFLHHKVAALPSETFSHLLAVLQALRIQLPKPLTRGDLPLHPHPEAAAREEKFQQDIRALARTAIHARAVQANAMAGVLIQGAQAVRVASMPSGSYYYS